MPDENTPNPRLFKSAFIKLTEPFHARVPNVVVSRTIRKRAAKNDVMGVTSN